MDQDHGHGSQQDQGEEKGGAGRPGARLFIAFLYEDLARIHGIWCGYMMFRMDASSILSYKTLIAVLRVPWSGDGRFAGDGDDAFGGSVVGREALVAVSKQLFTLC